MDAGYDDIELTSIARCRELLAEEADDLTDREVDDIRRHADAFAHAIVRTFLELRALDEERCD